MEDKMEYIDPDMSIETIDFSLRSVSDKWDTDEF